MNAQSFEFPQAWQRWVDESIPSYVKQVYSPKASWKGKPFSREDSRFFFRGIEELSELFTEERPRKIPPYFRHPKYRSAYLLYFLPLQAAKFVTLFQMFPKAIDAALEHGTKVGVLRILDLGAGPGTASLALLIHLLSLKSEVLAKIPEIEIHLLDTDEAILKDGRNLIEQLREDSKNWQGKLTIRTSTSPWWNAPRVLKDLPPGEKGSFSLVFMGHVLNESNRSIAKGNLDKSQQSSMLFWSWILTRVNGGGVLMVEPATRNSAQILSQTRDFLLLSSELEAHFESVWGPCLHTGACPLSGGRDWCHFSFPVRVPGKWFKEFSIGLGSERQWLKLSYLWLASSQFPAPKAKSYQRRIISDPLSSGRASQILLCEPERPRKERIPEKMNSSDSARFRRGGLFFLKSGSGRKA